MVKETRSYGIFHSHTKSPITCTKNSSHITSNKPKAEDNCFKSKFFVQVNSSVSRLNKTINLIHYCAVPNSSIQRRLEYQEDHLGLGKDPVVSLNFLLNPQHFQVIIKVNEILCSFVLVCVTFV